MASINNKPRFHSEEFREQITRYVRHWFDDNYPLWLVGVQTTSDFRSDTIVCHLDVATNLSRHSFTITALDYENHPSMILPGIANMLAKRFPRSSTTSHQPPFTLQEINDAQDEIDGSV